MLGAAVTRPPPQSMPAGSSNGAWRSFDGPAQLCFVPRVADDDHDDDAAERAAEPANRRTPDDGHEGCITRGRHKWQLVTGHLFQAAGGGGGGGGAAGATGYRSIAVRLLPAGSNTAVARPALHKCCAAVEVYDLSFLESYPPQCGAGARGEQGEARVWNGTVHNVLREAEGGDAARLSTELLRGGDAGGGGGAEETLSSSPAPGSPIFSGAPPGSDAAAAPLFSFSPTVIKTGPAAIQHARKFFAPFANAIQRDEAEGWVVCLGHATLRAPAT